MILSLNILAFKAFPAILAFKAFPAINTTTAKLELWAR